MQHCPNPAMDPQGPLCWFFFEFIFLLLWLRGQQLGIKSFDNWKYNFLYFFSVHDSFAYCLIITILWHVPICFPVVDEFHCRWHKLACYFSYGMLRFFFIFPYLYISSVHAKANAKNVYLMLINIIFMINQICFDSHLFFLINSTYQSIYFS